MRLGGQAPFQPALPAAFLAELGAKRRWVLVQYNTINGQACRCAAENGGLATAQGSSAGLLWEWNTHLQTGGLSLDRGAQGTKGLPCFPCSWTGSKLARSGAGLFGLCAIASTFPVWFPVLPRIVTRPRNGKYQRSFGRVSNTEAVGVTTRRMVRARENPLPNQPYLRPGAPPGCRTDTNGQPERNSGAGHLRQWLACMHGASGGSLFPFLSCRHQSLMSGPGIAPKIASRIGGVGLVSLASCSSGRALSFDG